MNFSVVEIYDELTYSFGYLSFIYEDYRAKVKPQKSGRSNIEFLIYFTFCPRNQNIKIKKGANTIF